MNNEVKNLYEIILHIAVLHQTLIETLQDEKQCMVSVDAATLLEITQAKEALLSRILSSEQTRLAATKAVMEKFEISLENASLLGIAEALKDNGGAEFRAAHKALALLTDRAKAINAENMKIATESLERIELMKKNILGLSNNNQENYNAQGSRHPIGNMGGRLLSREA